MQIHNLKAMIGIRRIERMWNERIKELIRVRKRVDGVINESAMRCMDT